MEKGCRSCLSCLQELWDRIWPVPASPQASPSRPEIAVISCPPLESRLPQLTPTPLLATKSRPVYAALYDFQARSPEELSLKKGERLRIIRDEGEYLFAQKSAGSKGAEGLVPTNYVQVIEQLSNEPWYFETISRANAEKLLQAADNENGTFLVRKSETGDSDYSISALNDKVHHFRIFTSPEGMLYLHENKMFPTISDLLEFYKRDWRTVGFPITNPCAKNVYIADEWERPKDEFTLLRKLGEGHFGEVWEGVWKENQHVAIKMLKKDDMIEDEFVKEVKAMKNINHPKIIKLLATCSIEEPIYIVTELMTKGNLQDYLRGDEGETLTVTHHVYMASQVADGMAYLERHKFVHRDLAARNVLVGEELTCKVADFGLARLIRDDVYHVRAGTKIPVKWTAPEAANYQRYSVKSDVWSFGILLYEMVTYGEEPYKGMTNKEVMDRVNDGYRMPCPENCSQDIYGIMLRCWNESEESRPPFSALLDELNSLYTAYYYKNQDQAQ
ncbi:tyrosine-protein kinase Srms-like isoform X2 [Scyliorhinus torazame]|uniref:tyrosine-protein kinase Srms-like isoform X2 n=1 Tax=Scyliorhinus torazame TaxID=75743 RepID=UPI003B5C1255